MQRRFFLIHLGAAGAMAWRMSISCAAASGDLSPIPVRELYGLDRPPSLIGKGFHLRREAAEAFSQMQADARREQLEIFSQSSYRSFTHQANIWNQNYRRLARTESSPSRIVSAILQYSSLPGASRHHWGTDIDLVDRAQSVSGDPLVASLFAPGGAYHRLYAWLQSNASRYGFYEVYTNQPNRPGFAYEPWHWSFAPLSIPLLKQFCSLSLETQFPKDRLLGAEVFTPEFFRRFVQQWMLGINPALVPPSLHTPE